MHYWGQAKTNTFNTSPQTSAITVRGYELPLKDYIEKWRLKNDYFFFMKRMMEDMIMLLVHNHIQMEPATSREYGAIGDQVAQAFDYYVDSGGIVPLLNWDIVHSVAIAEEMERDFVASIPIILPPSACYLKRLKWVGGRLFGDLYFEQ